MKYASVALVVLLPLSIAQAQTDSPRAVADSFYAATSAGRWERAAEYLDMEAFTRFLRQRVNSARSQLPPPPMTVDNLMAMDSTMPRAVAEWQIDQRRRFTDARKFHDFSEEFFGITTFRALDALSPLEGAVRWLEAQDPGARMRRQIEERKCPGSDPSALPTPAVPATRVLAVVELTDSTAYALTTSDSYTTRTALEDRMPPTAVLLRRRSGAWRMVPNHWLMNGRGTMFLSVQCEPARVR